MVQDVKTFHGVSDLLQLIGRLYKEIELCVLAYSDLNFCANHSVACSQNLRAVITDSATLDIGLSLSPHILPLVLHI